MATDGRQAIHLKNYRMLSRALEYLPAFPDRGRLLTALPRLLAELGEGGDVAVWVPTGRGFRLFAASRRLTLKEVADTGLVGRAFSSGKPVHVSDVRKDPDFIPEPSLEILSELAIPLFEREEPVAVLNVDRPVPFHPTEVEGLVRFGASVSAQLTQRAEAWEAGTLAQLSQRLIDVAAAPEVARAALAVLAEALEAPLGAVLRPGGVLAEVGGARPPAEVRRRLLRLRVPAFFANDAPWPGLAALAVLPLPGGETAIAIGHPEPHPWRRAERSLLKAAGGIVGLAFARARERERLLRTEKLVLRAFDAPLRAAAEQILAEAVALIPGAQGGTLLLKEEGRFRLAAAIGYDLEALASRSIDEAALALWYGDALELKKPRVRRGRAIPWQALRERLGDALPEAGKIRATLGLPVAYGGEVLAFLNVENFENEGAFDEESVYVAEAFAAPIAALLHEVGRRSLLERIARRDPLTGLFNRRAFDERLAEELARARRYRQPLALVVLDLQGFKAINDELGHAAGDRALVAVAEALKANLRETDRAYRWGGDEFALILPQTGGAEAKNAARRHAAAIAAVAVEGRSLAANFGVASFPEDGDDARALLEAADRRMYRAKARGQSLL